MARRKNGILSDGESSGSEGSASEGFDSQEDDDARAERRLFKHHQRKRPRTAGNGKSEAWEGVFGEEESPATRGGLGSRGGQTSRPDWTKAPMFVQSAATPDSKRSSPSRNTPDETAPPSPRDTAAGEEESGMMRGLGFRKSTATTPANSTPALSEDEGSDIRPGLGRGTINSSDRGERSNFVASRFSAPKPSTKTHELSNTEKLHFNKISDSFGARLLAKQGWAPGKGLGVDEGGRAVPVAVGRMMRGEGIKSGIRTEDSKREARRRGELLEDEPKDAPSKGKPKAPRPDGWKREKRVKPRKHQFRTYEQLLEEVGGETARPGIGQVIDARGGELRTVESLSELSLSGWTPTADKSELPELRHNLQLIVNASKTELANLVREGKSVSERRQWSIREEERARRKVEDSSASITRLHTVRNQVGIVSGLAQHAAHQVELSIESLEDSFGKLLDNSDAEYTAMALDEVVVGALDLVLRSTFLSWQPFGASSDALLMKLKPLRRAFNLPTPRVQDAERVMTPWESLLWHRWLPRVRSTLNNDWDPTYAQPAVHLLESWESLLPPFIRDNIIDQLVLPKVKAAMEDWNVRKCTLASILFPWLPLVDNRKDELLDVGKRRLRSALRQWPIELGENTELRDWRVNIYSESDWDKLMADTVIGKLGACLREDVSVNPRELRLEPLEWVMPWRHLIRASNFARIFELEFFPKWLDILHVWLIHPGHNGDEIAGWFEMVKSRFPPDLLSHRSIAHGFSTGLKLMQDALLLDEQHRAALGKPEYNPHQPRATDTTRRRAVRQEVQPEDITFRSIVEEHVAAHDLLLLPLGRSHETTGRPLFRVAQALEGKGGVTVYFGEDAVFALNPGGVYRAISLTELERRAAA